MTRKICVTAVDGQTGFAIAELLLQHRDFSRKADAVVGLALNAKSDKARELEAAGAQVVQHKPGRVREMVNVLRSTGCDTICLVPPAHHDKYDICVELVEAAKKAEIANVLLISSAGCDYATADKQPRLREFIDLETLVLQSKGDASTPTGGSPCVIRAGFYAENLLLYEAIVKNESTLPLPIGGNHKFAPVALGDIANIAGHVLTGSGKHGFDDRHRGQMVVVTGPMLCAGEELASSASKVLGADMKFENISEAEAKRILKSQSGIDPSEQQYLLDYYSLVREGKTNYISTTAFHDVTGEHPTEPDDFFTLYKNEMRPKKVAKRNH
ncbi:NAD(P)H azoreductase [Beauveria bassiana]|uniref:NAD(P)H azoreductase n=1 Tax=Beauveria bassiana TaxID=176275 RepID=A0A2N6P120_BEABA|nr:NAD(P)H azoreductase [Beauveria bassiana]